MHKNEGEKNLKTKLSITKQKEATYDPNIYYSSS